MLLPPADAGVRTLVDLLRARVGESSDLGFRFLARRETPPEVRTFADLDRRARAVAVALTSGGSDSPRGVVRGDRALLCYPPGLEFLAGLFGSLYAGLVAVPAYPPRPHKPDTRLQSIAASCRPAVVLTTGESFDDRNRLTRQTPGLADVPWLATDRLSDERADDCQVHAPRPDELAVLQYTSGSTGDPKGVMLTHACALHNVAGIQRAMRLERGNVGVTWLPAFHDMGLIGNLLGTLWFPGTLHVLSPLAMLQDPFRWLEVVSQTRAYISGGPCFAYEQCLKRITAEQRKQLDLSAWKMAYVGAEPISPRVLDEFARTFAECGFRRESLYPCFGLAESSLMVTGGVAWTGPTVRGFHAPALEQDRAIPAEKGRLLVGNGAPIPDMDVRIVDPTTGRTLTGGNIGEVWVSGPSVAVGYFERPEATAETFHARLEGETERNYLRTGDLGFVYEGELFIAGRLKDVLIIRGRNYYPQDIEEQVQLACPLLRSSGCAAFTVESDEAGARLIVVCEVARGVKPGQAETFEQARAAVAEEFGVELSEMALIRAGTLARTSSGKIARRETRQRFVAGDLEVVERFAAPVTEVPEAGSEPVGVQVQTVRTWLVDRLARQLGVRAERIDVDKPFATFGLDSLAMVRIAGDLERWLGRPLSPTLLYSAPTVRALAHALTTDPSQPGDEATRAVLDQRIAIIGIGCRFPGADGPEAFWELLRDGKCTIRDIPEGRWAERDRPLTTTHAGYLDDVRLFDASFFGIPPREAAWIDPQHRLLLEVAHHALEDAGLAVDRLAGSRTGVFVGISGNDYGKLLLDHAGADAYLATGNAASMAAHRLSYHLDLHGPSLSLDTACSSSLTAVHTACQSLRNGECDLALAGGVNLILSPDVTEALSRARMLSPSAKCKSFDASADGYVRGEGCGVVVLKPVALALRDGDPIHAIIEATAVNQDGRSNGITAPNGKAQAALVRQALARAGRSAADVGYVETHGTGTALGDPIEFDALREALGGPTLPCVLGAVKTNVGHLEAAAGIAGLIKTTLQLRHAQIAPLVHLETVNPLVRLEGTRFRLPRTLSDWPRSDRPRVAGVSSFGFGGTNVHVVLSEPPLLVPTTPGARTHLLPLSARSEPALRELATTVATLDGLEIADVAHTLAVGRMHLPHRLVVRASTLEETSAALTGWVREGRDSRVLVGKAFGDLTNRIAFLFTGQGAAFAGMARSFDDEPVFHAALDRVEEIVRGLAGWSVRAVLEDPERIEETEFAQPALVAFEFALASLWRSWGVEPAAVLGHSVGEIAAAVVAGILSLEEGARLAVERGRLMQACPLGAMLACLAAVEQVQPTLARWSDDVALAACNGPRQCVLAGRPGPLAAVGMELTEQRIDTRPLAVRRGFHSALIEPAVAGLRGLSWTHHPAKIAFVSNVSGGVVQGILPSDYWADHARTTVRFESGIQTLERSGITHFVEIGPSLVLGRLGATCIEGGTWLASTRGEHDRSLARLHVDGANLDWTRIQPPGRRLRLPGYPFQRRSYWLDDLPRSSRTRSHEQAPAPALFRGWRRRSCWSQCLPREPLTFGPLEPIVAGTVDAAWQEQPLDTAVRLRPEFDRLAGLWIVGAFSRLGWRPAPGETTTETALASRLEIVPHKMRLLDRLLRLASEDGWLTRNGQEVNVLQVPPGDDASKVFAGLLERYPEFAVELRLAQHCARHLAEVLRGSVDPLQVLFDGEAGQLTAEIYSRAPVARFYNTLLKRAVAQLLGGFPAGRTIRVLELGAGTGGTTQALLPVLPAGRVEYVFTDVSSLFLARAREQFASHEALECRMLDLERDPLSQGFAPGRFDLVLASNVLHATADLRQSVRHARQMLAPGGVLVLLEGTGPRRLLDLIFGLTEGWWRFSDDGLRPSYPLVSPGEWSKLLAEEGFDAIQTLPGDDPRLPDPDQVVLLARATVTEVTPDRTGNRDPRPWLIVGDHDALTTALHQGLEAEGVSVVRAHPEERDDLLPQLEGSPPSRAVFLPGTGRTLPPGSIDQAWVVTIGEEPGSVSVDEWRVDLDPGHAPEQQARILVEALCRPDGEHVVVYRGDDRLVPMTPAVVEKADVSATVIAAPERATLLAASPYERRSLVEDYLKQELAILLGATLSDEDVEMPVQSLGLDSLMAIQVRNRVETNLGVALSLVDFLKGLRVRQLVDNIVEQLDRSTPAHEERPLIADVEAEEVAALSESELDSLLGSMLDQPQDAR